MDVPALGGADTITTAWGRPGPARSTSTAGTELTPSTTRGTHDDDDGPRRRNGVARRRVRPGGGTRATPSRSRASTCWASAARTRSPGARHRALTQLTIDGGAGDDTLRGGDGADLLHRRRRRRPHRRQPRRRHRAHGRRRRHLPVGSGRRQRHRRGPGRRRPAGFNGSNVGEKIDLSANGRACGSPATSPASRWTSTASRRLLPLGGVRPPVNVSDLSGHGLDHRRHRPQRHRRRRATAPARTP